MEEVTESTIFDRLWMMLGLERRQHPGRYTVLLISILFLLVSQPLVAGHAFAQVLVTMSMTLVLLSALYTFESSKTFFIIGLLTALPAIGTRWILQFTQAVAVEKFAAISTVLFLALTVVGLVVELFTAKRITLDSISAAICAYLLMGVAWGFIFVLVDISHPGSFSGGLTIGEPAGGFPRIMATLHNFIYYSFVCLTTTGYGDIAPLSQPARLFSILESITGQLYLAILISRLVSLEVAQSMDKKR